MKNLIIVLSLSLITNSLFAGPGGGGGGIGTLPPQEILMNIPIRDISEFLSVDGSYSRLDDLIEGHVELKGVTFLGEYIVIEQRNAVHSIINQEGKLQNLK